MKKNIRWIILLVAIVIFGLFFYFSNRNKTGPSQTIIQAPSPQNNNASSSQPIVQKTTPGLKWPIDRPMERILKKPFGIYITLQNSPVQPERFSGYHTGVDFETFADEQNTNAPIYAICEGRLLVKEWASGYGGVAVQACKLDNQDVTIIYGHLRISSVILKQGQEIAVGEKIAVLGTGYSSETDGERRHLHLGIHKGKAINILGYAQSQSQLQNWLDITKYISI